MRLFIMVFAALFCAVSVEAWTSSQISRVAEARKLFQNAEKRLVKDILAEFETGGSPEASIGIYEAMAKTFRDINSEYGDDTPESRVRLFSKIKLNMAYFQMSGSRQESPGGSILDRLIQRTLKRYLPEDVWSDPKLFHSLD